MGLTPQGLPADWSKGIILSLIKPTGEGVREKNSVMCKFVMHHFQSCIIIGLTGAELHENNQSEIM